MALIGGSSLRSRFGWRAFVFSLIILGIVTVGTGLYWRSRVIATAREALTAHIGSVAGDIELDLSSGFDPWDDGGTTVLPAPETGIQVMSSGGEVLAASADLRSRSPLVSPQETLRDQSIEVRETVEGFGDALIVASASELDGETFVIAAVTSLDELDTACVAMCVVAPIAALVISAAIGLGVAASVGAALEPVRQLAGRASEISGSGHPEPLQVPAHTSELQELSSNLDHLLEQIRVAFDREQQFLDDASHELRTPIAIARAELDLARRAAVDADTQHSLGSALEELRRLDAMAADLLILARERAAGSMGHQPVDLATVAHGAAAQVRQDPRQGPVVIEVTGRGMVSGDPGSLERALQNVIANAARFCEELVTVEIVESAEVTVTVVDDGPGIADHLIDTLFDRFVRGRDRGAHSTGLGTAIAAEVVRNHGGTISARNRDEGGAEVRILLPRLGS